MLQSDVPEGAGLSSSAALEISTGLALTALSGINIDRITLALAGQKAEHDYVGTKSGIMDQYTSALARKNHALLIDCRTLEAAHIPLDNSEIVIAICNSNVRHALASSEYNTRRAECERGVELLQQFLPNIKALRDVSVREFEEYEENLPEPVRRRCCHVVTENDRTLEAVEALRRSDFQRMGRLMFESHESLRADYEVSCAELDALVEIAGRIEGVFGARMTGGGFGGCTVNLVRRENLAQFREIVSREYRKRINLKADICVAEASDGAQEIEIQDQA
ncbi:MAG: galactokinase [Pyrinomonadaceae bacterium]|nr:galactokinase [Pyrinomonadaceae bacterium]